MIRIFKGFYVHILFIVLICVSAFTGLLRVVLTSFFIMSVHELSHLAAALYLGAEGSHIAVYPFGLNLRLKNTLVFTPSDEVILYGSGPLSNIIMALIAMPFVSRYSFLYSFYMGNILLFFLNIIPVAPLDGGMIVKKILIYRFGFYTGCKASKVISCFLIIIFSLFSLFYLYMSGFNLSVLIFVLFLWGNLLISKEKYNTVFLKELMYQERKRGKNTVYKAKVIACDDECGLIDIAKRFSMSENYFVIITDKKHRVKRIMSEQEVIDEILLSQKQ